MLKNKYNFFATIMITLIVGINSHTITANWFTTCKRYSHKAFRITKRSIHDHATAIGITGGSILFLGICAYLAKKHHVSLSYTNNNDEYKISLQKQFPFVRRKKVQDVRLQHLFNRSYTLGHGSPSKPFAIPVPKNSAQNKNRSLREDLPEDFNLNDFLSDSEDDTSTDYSTIKYKPSSNGTIVIPDGTVVLHNGANQGELPSAVVNLFNNPSNGVRPPLIHKRYSPKKPLSKMGKIIKSFENE